MNRQRALFSAIPLAVVALAAAAGCGDDEAAITTMSSSTGSGGSGGSGGFGPSGGSGGSGGAGGGAGGCLPSSDHESVFAIEQPELCLVATFTAPFAMGYSSVPTWGRHGGPLVMEQATSPVDAITLTRWSAPGGAGGALTVLETIGPVSLQINETTLFMNPAAVDLPFANWTLTSWSEFGSTDGEAILLDGPAIDTRFAVAGFYVAAGLSDANGTRLLHQSLTGLNDALGTQVYGLYASDICNGAPCGPSTLLFGAGDASGALSVDADGNVFATFPSLANNEQSARGFAASTVAPGAPATTGDELFTTSGSGTAMAALAPADGEPGLLLLQHFDGVTFEAADVLVQRYRADSSGVSADGTLDTALTLATPGTPLNLMADDAGRLWVAVDSGASESVFYVLARTTGM